MTSRVYLKEYDINLTANGIQVLLVEGSYFRIQSSLGGVTINVDGLGELPGLLAGQGIANTPFKRLILRDVSGAANVGKILISNEAFVDNRTFGVSTLDAFTLAALESVDLNAATLNALNRPLAFTGSTNTTIALTAQTAEAIVLPAANVNGVIVLAANLQSRQGANGSTYGGLLGKATAPLNISDGAVLAAAQISSYESGNLINTSAVNLITPVFVPAGLGIYWIMDQAIGTGYPRSVRWRTL